jgi:MoxR-like ATPase
MSSDSSAGRSDAAARAALLAARAKELRRSQQEVLGKTTRELTALAHAAVMFFPSLPLMEFSPALFPHTARSERHIRHRVLHRTISQDESVHCAFTTGARSAGDQ